MDPGVVFPRRGAELKLQLCLVGHDVDGRSPGDAPDVDRHMGGTQFVVRRAAIGACGGEFVLQGTEALDEVARKMDGAHMIHRQRGVGGAAGEARVIQGDPFVGGDDAHLGRLADKAEARAHRGLGQGLRHPVARRGSRPLHRRCRRGGAAPPKSPPSRRWSRAKSREAANEGLHVARSAPVEAPALFCELKGGARPILPIHRDDIGVAREHHSAPVGGADRGEEVGLGLVFAVDELALNPRLAEFV